MTSANRRTARRRIGITVAAFAMLALVSSCSLFKDIFFGSLFTVTIDASDLGSISVAADGANEATIAGAYAYREGTTVTISAVAEEGSVFDSWSGSYSSFDMPLSFEISRDTALTPNFVELDDPWLVMVYMAAANSLECDALFDINAMERGLFDADPGTRSNAKVVVLFDRIAGDEDGDWAGTRLYELRPDDNERAIASSVIQSASASSGQWRSGPDDEMRMGDSGTLTSFVSWAASAYPQYRRHALVLWNHGSGLFSSKALDSGASATGAGKSVCFDDEDKTADGYGQEGQLFIGEIADALAPGYDNSAGAGYALEVIGFDACYMGMYEIAYEFRDCAKYFVASPAEEFGGWNYTRLLSTSGAFTSGQTFTREVVKGYQAKSSLYPNTMVAFDISKIRPLKIAVDSLATALSSNQAGAETARDASVQYSDSSNTLATALYPYHDLGDFCANLIAAGIASAEARAAMDALMAGGVYAWTDTAYGGFEGAGISNGLSIFWSHGDELYQGESQYLYQGYYTSDPLPPGDGYGRIDAADSDGGAVSSWREMLDSFYP